MITTRGIYVKSPSVKPETVVDIELTVIGGSGGTGGNDANGRGYAGYPGKQVNGTSTLNLTDKLTINIGGGGSNGRSGTQGGGGEGGSSLNGYRGGTGGGAGYAGSSGAGGGGGAASTVSLNGSLLLVAAGGPGGGGAGNGPYGQPTQGFQSSGSIAGAQGEDKGGDGGGGGGGGGGNPGGAGGVTRGGDYGAYSGSYGQSSYPTGYTETGTQRGPNLSGSAVITYTSSINEPYFTGGRISITPQGNNTSTITHTFNESGTLVGRGLTIAQNVQWREVLVPSVKAGGQWKEITAAYTKVNDKWEKVFPSSGSIEYKTPGVYYWTVPAGINTITYTLIGGGGGGGAAPEDVVDPPADRGCKIICTKLFELGYLSETIYEADERFGEYLRENDPYAYYGYVKWASVVVDWMEKDGPQCMFWIRDRDRRNTAQKEMAISWARRIATPWAEHMAYIMGVGEKDNRAGRLIMKTGMWVSRMIGKYTKTTEPTKNVALGYVMWLTFGIFWLLAGVK